jgi:ribonuclease D
MIVKSEQQLNDICDRRLAVPAIFHDIELVSEGRYYPDLGTTQLAAKEMAALEEL